MRCTICGRQFREYEEIFYSQDYQQECYKCAAWYNRIRSQLGSFALNCRRLQEWEEPYLRTE